MATIFGAPPIDGLGKTGGFKMIIEDRGNLGPAQLQAVSDRIVDKANATPGLQGAFNGMRADTPWLYLDIDRTKCEALGLSLSNVFDTLQVYLGSYYVNNFNEFGRSWQVNVMADANYRKRVDEVKFWLDANSFLPTQVEYRSDRQVRQIRFDDIRLNPDLSAELYTMDIPSDVEVTSGFSGLPDFDPDATQ